MWTIYLWNIHIIFVLVYIECLCIIEGAVVWCIGFDDVILTQCNLVFLQGSQIPSFACVCSWIRLGSRLWFFRIRWWHTCSWWPNDIQGHLSNCWLNWFLFFPFDFTSFSLLSQFLINHNARTSYTAHFILVG